MLCPMNCSEVNKNDLNCGVELTASTIRCAITSSTPTFQYKLKISLNHIHDILHLQWSIMNEATLLTHYQEKTVVKDVYVKLQSTMLSVSMHQSLRIILGNKTILLKWSMLTINRIQFKIFLSLVSRQQKIGSGNGPRNVRLKSTYMREEVKL